MYTTCFLTILFVFLAPIWASHAVPNYRLNDGHLIPVIGLGTWFGMRNLTHAAAVDAEAMEQAVGWAIDDGYRLVDTSPIYSTEGSEPRKKLQELKLVLDEIKWDVTGISEVTRFGERIEDHGKYILHHFGEMPALYEVGFLATNIQEVGRAVQRKIAEGVIKRKDMFITTKLWNDAHARDAVVPALRMSLQALNLSYVDMYLIHFPVGQFNNGTYDLTDYLETWCGMIDAKRQGLTRSIGVSNFNEHMIERIIKGSCVKPAVVQFEENLTIQLYSLLKYCCKNEIAVMGYTPFGSIWYEQALPGAPPPRVDDPLLQQIALGHNKTVPQIILRYLVDLGIIPIPKSVNKSHIKENIDIFDFNLLPEERIVLGGYNVKYRTGKIWSDSPYYLTRPLFF